MSLYKGKISFHVYGTNGEGIAWSNRIAEISACKNLSVFWLQNNDVLLIYDEIALDYFNTGNEYENYFRVVTCDLRAEKCAMLKNPAIYIPNCD
jgi:hypothetical protein